MTKNYKKTKKRPDNKVKVFPDVAKGMEGVHSERAHQERE
jgi:hypothetical protein